MAECVSLAGERKAKSPQGREKSDRLGGTGVEASVRQAEVGVLVKLVDGVDTCPSTVDRIDRVDERIHDCLDRTRPSDPAQIDGCSVAAGCDQPQPGSRYHRVSECDVDCGKQEGPQWTLGLANHLIVNP